MTAMKPRKTYQSVEETSYDEANHRLRLAQTINDVMRGNIDCIRDQTIKTGTTTTTIVDNRIGYYSAIIITTLNEAGYLIRSTIRETGRGKGSVTLTHSPPASPANIRMVIIG